MKVRYLVVKMSSVSTRIIPDPLNLPLQAMEPARLVTNAVPECLHNLSESVHLRGQVVESHV